MVVVADPAEAAAAAAERIAAVLAEAVARRGRADWATTGGSSVVGIYRNLVAEPLRDAVSWPAVHVWWGDDRYVPRDHPLSNVKPLDDILLAIGADRGRRGRRPGTGRRRCRRANVHPFRTGEAIGGSRGPAWCARALADELRGGTSRRGWAVAGLRPAPARYRGGRPPAVGLPGLAALGASELALAIPAPSHIEPRVERVTLNPAVVGVARQVLVVATRRRRRPPSWPTSSARRASPRRWPAQLARRVGGDLDPRRRGRGGRSRR